VLEVGRNFKIDKLGSNTFSVRGSWQGQTLSDLFRRAGFQAMRDTIQQVYDQSQREVPRDSEQLAESGRIVEDPEAGRVSVVYGDSERHNGNAQPSSTYARVQHEDTTLAHPRGGKAKFVEDPLKASVPDFERNLRRRIEEALH
jgi:hypothetical protein